MSLDLSTINFSVNTKPLEAAAAAIGELVTNVGKLDKAARDAAQTEATLARAAKDNAKANLDNAKAQDVRLKSTIAADKADQQATAAIEKKTKATEKVNEVVNKNVGVLQRQKDILEFQTQGFSKGQSSILAYGKAAGLAADDIGELGKVLETQRKLMGGDPFDKSLSGLKSLQNQYTELKESVRQYATDSNLTAKQARELARDKERLIEKMKVEGASFSEIRKAVRAHNAEYVNLATSYNKMTSAEDAVIKNRKEAVNATNYLTQADQKMAAALNTSNTALDKAGTDSLVKYETALRKSGISQDVATAKLAKYKAQLEQVQIQEQKRREEHLTRALAPQATDIVVSLWSGQNPLTVLLQQGGQVTDLFMQSGIAAEKFGEVVKSSMKSMLPSILTVVKGVGGLLVDGFVAAGNAVSSFLANTVGMTGALDKLYMKMSENGPSKWGGVIQGLSSLMTGVFAVGIAGVVTGLVALGTAAYQTMKEQDKLAQSLALYNGTLAVSHKSSLEYVAALNDVGVTTGNASAAITQMAKAGVFVSEDIMLVAKAAANLADYSDVAVEDTIKSFAKLKEKPVEALLEIAKQTGMVSIETIKMVEELQKAGKQSEASAAAMQAYADVTTNQVDRMKETYSSFGLFVMELGKKIKNFFSQVFKDIFYVSTESLRRDIARLEEMTAGYNDVPGYDPRRHELQVLKDKLAIMELESAAFEEQIKNNTEAAKVEEFGIKLREEANKVIDNSVAKTLNLTEYTKQYVKEKTKGQKVEADTLKLIEKAAEVEWKAMQKKDRGGSSKSENYFATLMRRLNNEAIGAEASQQKLTKAYAGMLELAADPRFLELTEDQKARAMNKLNEAHNTELATEADKKYAEGKALINNLLGKGEGLGKDYYDSMEKLEKLKGMPRMDVKEIEAAQKALQATTPFAKAMSEWFAKATEAVAKSNIETKLQLANIQAQNMELDHNLAMVGLSEEAQKRLTTEFTKQRDLMKAKAEYEKIRSDIMKDGSYGTDENKNKALENAASVYQATITQINRKAVDDLFTYYTSKAAEAGKNSFGSLSDVLKQAGQLTFATAVNSLGELIDNFDTLTAKQELYNKARAEAQGDTSKLQKLDKAHAVLQVKSYGDIAKSMKGFFKEGTTGYKVMGAAEKAFRVYEMAMAVKNNAFKLAAMWGEVKTFVATTAKMIAGVTAEESVKTSTRVPGIFAAFMSTMGPWGIPAAIAAMAAVGIAASGSSAPAVVTNQGTGTVFGDSSAKSESINNSLDILKDVNTLTMHYSEKMLSSLRSIENLMAGVTNLILRSSGIEAAASGITEGTKLPSVFDFGIVSKIPVVGKLVGSLFGTKTKITGQGVYAEDTKLEDVMSKGIEAGYYVDINKKKKAFGVTYSNKNSTNKTIDDQLSKQFTLIIENFLDVIKSAAPVLGFTTDQIDANLKDFVVKIGKIDLKGLSGKEIQEKLTAVFGAAGDDMAKAALPGFEKFQKVGEGYLETVVRVAYATESLRGMMDTLGVSTVLTVDSAMALVDTFGDLEIAMDKLGAYYDAFYTEAERNATLQRQLTREFAAQNLKLPTTREEYRKLVEAQDLNTEAGRKMYAFLLTLAPAFAEIVDAAEQLANARTDIIYRMMEQEAQLLATQGRTAEADKKRRELLDKQRGAEYERLMKVNPELARLTAELWALEDAAVAAAKVKEIADTRQDLTDRILQQEAELLGAQGRTVEADKKRRELLDRQRARENERLMALNPELAKLAYELWLLEDATVAATKAAALEREISDNRRDYTDRILQQEAELLDAQGRTAEADRKRRELLDRQRARENERLMKLNPELAKLAYELWLLEDATAAATRAAKERTEISNDLYNALVKAVDAEKTLLDEQKARLEETVSTLKAVFDILKSSVEDLYGEVSSTAAMQASEGRGVIAQAIATGVLPDSELLDTSIQAVRDEISNSLYVSKADADKARLIFAAQLALLEDTTEEQLTDAEKQLKAVNAQISYLDNILKTAKEQLDAFLGNTEVLKSVDKALADLYAFLQNPSAAKPVPKPVGTEKPGNNAGTGGGAVFGPGGGGGSSQSYSYYRPVGLGTSIGYQPVTDEATTSRLDKLSSLYHSFDGTGDLVGLLNSIKTAGGTMYDLEALSGHFYNDWVKAGMSVGIPAFADGGNYRGGMALVGEEGPELINFSNPGQVYTARQTASMLSGESSEVVAELKAVRSEIIMLRAEVRADVSHNAKTAKLLDRVIPEGDSVQVTIS